MVNQADVLKGIDIQTAYAAQELPQVLDAPFDNENLFGEAELSYDGEPYKDVIEYGYPLLIGRALNTEKEEAIITSSKIGEIQPRGIFLKPPREGASREYRGLSKRALLVHAIRDNGSTKSIVYNAGTPDMILVQHMYGEVEYKILRGSGYFTLENERRQKNNEPLMTDAEMAELRSGSLIMIGPNKIYARGDNQGASTIKFTIGGNASTEQGLDLEITHIKPSVDLYASYDSTTHKYTPGPPKSIFNEMLSRATASIESKI